MAKFTLAGFEVTPSEHQRLTFVINFEKETGWKPTREDIKCLIKLDRHLNPEIQRETAELVRECRREKR